jgi:hypothetical protein
MKGPDRLTLANKIVLRIRPMLAGHDPDVVGAALAELVAIFFASHHPKLRGEQRDIWVRTMDDLIPVCLEQMIDEGKAPPQWRGKAALS